jgi:hypothetical protein
LIFGKVLVNNGDRHCFNAGWEIPKFAIKISPNLTSTTGYPGSKNINRVKITQLWDEMKKFPYYASPSGVTSGRVKSSKTLW